MRLTDIGGEGLVKELRRSLTELRVQETAANRARFTALAVSKLRAAANKAALNTLVSQSLRRTAQVIEIAGHPKSHDLDARRAARWIEKLLAGEFPI